MIHVTLTGELKFDEKSYLHLTDYLSTSYLLIRKCYRKCEAKFEYNPYIR